MGALLIRFHYDGFNELRQSYQSDIDAIGAKAAASANAMTRQTGDDDRGGQSPSEEPFVYEPRPNKTRARGLVKTATYAGRRAQATDDVLTRAVLGGGA